MCACFHEFQLTFQTDVKSLTLKSFSFWTIRFVEFTLRFTVLLMASYGQSWLTKRTWFCISSLFLNHLNVMVHLLVKSTYFIWPKSLSNLCSNPLFRRTRWYFTDETLARLHMDSYGSVHIGVQRIRKSKMTLHMGFARLLA